MGEIDVLAELQKDNPSRRAVDLQVFADALAVYIEASANIQKNGAITAHPRTGAPIENPYLKVQAAKGEDARGEWRQGNADSGSGRRCLSR